MTSFPCLLFMLLLKNISNTSGSNFKKKKWYYALAAPFGLQVLTPLAVSSREEEGAYAINEAGHLSGSLLRPLCPAAGRVLPNPCYCGEGNLSFKR